MPAASTAGGRGVSVIAVGLLLVVLAGLVAPTRAAARPAQEGNRNPVSDWNGIALEAIVVDRPPGSSAVLLGIVQLAVHDTVVAIHGGYRPYAARPGR